MTGSEKTVKNLEIQSDTVLDDICFRNVWENKYIFPGDSLPF